MTDQPKRSQLIYEHLPGYVVPPMIPIPEPGDISSLANTGIRLTPGSERLIRAFLHFSGFMPFWRKAPDILEDLLRQHSMRLPGLCSPIISATAALVDDPRPLSPLARAATLVISVCSLYSDLMCAKLSQDTYRGQPLEMGQYANLFSTSLVIENRQVRMHKSVITTQITVIVNHRVYIQEIGHPGENVSMVQIQEALEKIAQRASNSPSKEASIGTLTAAGNHTQFRAFDKLLQNPENAEAYQKLRDSLFTLCLDLDTAPADDAEAARLAHSQNHANRYHHSSLQLVVFGNGKACGIFNFTTYLDGNPMSRSAAEIQKRAILQELAVESPTNFTQQPFNKPLSEARELSWSIDPKMVQMAQQETDEITDHQVATLEIVGIGRRFFDAAQLSAVPAFITALQMTTDRLVGQSVQVTQFLTLSRYRCMDLETAEVSTPNLIECARLLNQEVPDPNQAYEHLCKAVLSQTDVMRQVRQELNLEVLIMLFLKEQKGVRKFFRAVMLVLCMTTLMVMKALKSPQKEILVSHPDIYPEVSVFGRPGVRLPYAKYYGLHYQIMDEKIVITMMPGFNWKISNADFIRELQASLEKIRLIIHVD
jgi:hypothetical protein